ncbi:hypothetical protein [Ornithinimicrobium murale]|uniref:hypothetical protein n=1 Tax=Ornithinimicrobium murale TaxID=1050153 RepID=UPI000E0D9E5F|nr:hypothetical protein [Ornithinimicrobium murale]
MPRWSLPRAALALVLALALLPALALLGTPGTAHAAPAAHPISGFFVAAASTDADNARTLDQVQQVGGDTVVTFGTTLRTGSLDSRDRIRTGGQVDPAFTACRLQGKQCATVAAERHEINRVFTFANHSRFTGAALQCPQDRTFTSKGQRFTLLLIPTEGEGCTSADGTYDLIAIHGGPAQAPDRTTSLLRAADRAGVQVYVGMPSVQKRSDVAWLPDLSYQRTFGAFTDRFLKYHRSVGQTAALAGFYHHTEMPVAGTPSVWRPVLDLYALQNRAIARVFPDTTALVSPYLDNRRSANPGLDREELMARTTTGARAIAGTAHGVPLAIAVQDGMGTGKGGAFLSNEAGSEVDPRTAAFVGEKTWDAAYLMPVSDSFSAARKGLQDTGATLWSNVEGMAPHGENGNACGSGQERGQSTKDRLDRQVQSLGRYTAKNISFMWTPFYTCRVDGTSLAQTIRRLGATPVITNAALLPERDVLWLAGYNLAGSTATVKYVDTEGRVHQATAKVSVFSPDYGRREGLDAGMQSAGYPVEFVAPQEGKIFIVSVTNPDGATSSNNFSREH